MKQLILDGLPITVDYENIDQASNEEFVAVRRNGLGGSDVSIVLGVNPYSTTSELMASKLRTQMTEEERRVGELSAVRKGRDLEPLVIDKWQRYSGTEILKPAHMYRFKEFPYLKMNFDGIQNTPEQYIPVEVKIITLKGAKNYDFSKAFFDERTAEIRPFLQNYAATNDTIVTKAHNYGIPPYYYTQLQDEMMALKAPYGYLAALYEGDWYLRVFCIHLDASTQNRIIIEGAQFWDKRQILKERQVTMQLASGEISEEEYNNPIE